MIVIAKMYVASVNMTGDAFNTEETRTCINFNCVYSPDPKTENHSFWKATPNGTLFISIPPGVDVNPAFVPGQCFKVYHEQAEDGLWRLNMNALEGSRMKIELSFAKGISEKYWSDVNARENMDIDNGEVFPFYASTQGRYNVWFVPVDKDGNEVGERIDL